MNTIWKFTVTQDQIIEVPEGARFIACQKQEKMPCLWAMVDSDAPLVERAVWIRGTGQECPTQGYVGTIQDGPFVWHFFVTHV